MMKKILNTDLVKINDTGTEYEVHIRLSRGGWIEHEPFPRTLQGLVSAMQLATEICAGKFFPRRVLTEKGEGVTVKKELLSASDKLTGRIE